jgi:hypothetical protein
MRDILLWCAVIVLAGAVAYQSTALGILTEELAAQAALVTILSDRVSTQARSVEVTKEILGLLEPCHIRKDHDL